MVVAGGSESGHYSKIYIEILRKYASFAKDLWKILPTFIDDPTKTSVKIPPTFADNTVNFCGGILIHKMIPRTHAHDTTANSFEQYRKLFAKYHNTVPMLQKTPHTFVGDVSME